MAPAGSSAAEDRIVHFDHEAGSLGMIVGDPFLQPALRRARSNPSPKTRSHSKAVLVRKNILHTSRDFVSPEFRERIDTEQETSEDHCETGR